MTKQQRLEAISGAMEYTGENPKDTRPNIYVISSVGGEIYNLLLGIIADLEASNDVNYEIVAKACDVITDLFSTRDINDFDRDELDEALYESEKASVYTDTRLGYLSIYNQDLITGKAKEYDCDIQTACAIWFDDQVKNVAHKLVDWILEGEEA